MSKGNAYRATKNRKLLYKSLNKDLRKRPTMSHVWSVAIYRTENLMFRKQNRMTDKSC